MAVMMIRCSGKSWRLAVLTAALAAAGVQSAAAQSVEEALARVFASNPELVAEREALNTARSNVDAARGAALPTAEVSGTVGVSHFDYDVALPGYLPEDVTETYVAQASVTQPVYTGGRIRNSISAARAAAEAAEAKLKSSEQQIFFEALAIYHDVVRDAAILEMRKGNERSVKRRLDQVRGLVESGVATVTDLRQAEARLAGAQAQRMEAAGKLESARASFERVIGVYPQAVSTPDLVSSVPATLEEVAALAEVNSPVIDIADFAREAAEYNIKVESGARRPEVGLQGYALYGRSGAIDSLSSALGVTDNDLTSVGVMLRLKVPLFQGGVPAAKTRAAKHEASRRAMEAVSWRRQVREAAIQAWHNRETAASVLAARQAQIIAAEKALEGVTAEYEVGRRTLLDVLDAQQELYDAKVAKVSSDRDFAVAQYGLLAVIGRLTASELGVEGA